MNVKYILVNTGISCIAVGLAVADWFLVGEKGLKIILLLLIGLVYFAVLGYNSYRYVKAELDQVKNQVASEDSKGKQE